MNFAFDIETAPLDEQTVLARCPEPKIPKNIKDPEKIQARIDGHKQEVMQAATLDAMLCRVAAIGYGGTDGGIDHDIELHLIDQIGAETLATDDDREAAMLGHFWQQFSATHELGFKLIGHTCHTFDVPMLIRRSWLLGVDVPGEVMERGRVSSTIIDLADVWRCGDRSCYASLAAMSRAFGLDGKLDGLSGGDWHKWYFSGDEDRRQVAIQYVARDVQATRDLAAAMGVM